MKNKFKHFTPPKFKKGETVSSPTGEHQVENITYTQGEHWYQVNNIFYGENEISKI